MHAPAQGRESKRSATAVDGAGHTPAALVLYTLAPVGLGRTWLHQDICHLAVEPVGSIPVGLPRTVAVGDLVAGIGLARLGNTGFDVHVVGVAQSCSVAAPHGAHAALARSAAAAAAVVDLVEYRTEAPRSLS